MFTVIFMNSEVSYYSGLKANALTII